MGACWFAIKELEAKKELANFIKLQAETSAIRDSIAKFSTAVIRI